MNKFLPKCFEETTNLWDANKWVQHIEGIFEVMACSEQRKVVLVSFKLDDDAKEWWKGATRSFIRKFIPNHIKAQKKRKFETLAESDLTIAKSALKIVFLKPTKYIE